MYKKVLYNIIILLIAILNDGCKDNNRTEDKVIAEVGSKKLLLSEIAAVVPDEIDDKDSAVFAEDYIRKWIRQELMLKKAEENLSIELKNVNRELEEYRNSLIIFRYKNELMAQRMDTTVSKAEILKYYNDYLENFKLNTNIVKAIYIKIPAEFANPEELKKMSSNSTQEGIDEIRDYCLQYAKGFDIFTEQWVDVERVMNNIPTTIKNMEQFLRNNKYIEYQDSSFYYLVAIHDYLLRNEQSPEEFVRQDIKNLILNRRKMEFLKNLENNIYQEGINRNSFKIYNSELNET
ncbi:MAG TPA: hypothetical protein VFD91_09505 [Mariniphaga sp.]|nr:hypothetical protein [Mariniphaga sp.]